MENQSVNGWWLGVPLFEETSQWLLIDFPVKYAALYSVYFPVINKKRKGITDFPVIDDSDSKMILPGKWGW